MGVSRVDFAGETLVDLTGDTVTPQNLLSGYSAHNRAGELIEGLAVIPTKVSELKNDMKYLTDTGDSSQTTVTFQEAVERANLNPGDSLAIAFGKLSKFCEDLKSVAFSGKYSDLTEKATAQDVGALPISGGTLSYNANTLLTLNRESGNFAGLEFLNQNGHIFVIEGYSRENGQGKQLNIFARDWNKSLLRINENNRVIYDHKTQSEKKILVEGEALPATGGTLKSTDYFPLHLERTIEGTGCGLDFKGTDGAVGNIQMTYDTSSNNENEFRCFVKDEDKKDVAVLRVSRENRKIYCKETGGTKNIITDYEVPFRFGIEEGSYGYYRNDNGEFVLINQTESGGGENVSNGFFVGANQSGFYTMKFYFSNLLDEYKEETPNKKKCVLSAIMKIEISVLDTIELKNENGTFGSTATSTCVDSYLYLCNSEAEAYKNPSGYDRVRFRVALKAIGGEFNSQYGKITTFSNAKNDNAGFTYEDFGLTITPASGYHFNVNIIPLSIFS